MSIDLHLIVVQPLTVAGLCVGLVCGKALILYALARLRGCGHGSAVKLALYISQGGEFAFVLFSVAAAAGALDRSTADTLVVVVSLSLVATPLFVTINDKWLKIGHGRGEARERETLLSSLELARDIFVGLGFSLADAQKTVDLFRRHDDELLARQHLIHEDEAQLIAAAKQGAEELERLFTEDTKVFSEPVTPARTAARP